jgi:hypothetical protein
MAKQTFTTGQVLTAAQMTSLQQTAMGGGSTTAKTASYVLVAADAGTVVQMNSASATTITVNTALFAAGDEVNIQNIGTGVCTITAGTATVSTAGSLALNQYEAGQLYFNSTSAALFFDIVQSAAGGKILQVVQGTTTTATTIATTTMTDTTITATITPTLATSKVLVLISAQFDANRSTGNIAVGAKILRGATTIQDFGTYGFAQVNATGASATGLTEIRAQSYLDSPATTSATTYKLQAAPNTTANSASVVFQVGSFPSSIILMEVGA